MKLTPLLNTKACEGLQGMITAGKIAGRETIVYLEPNSFNSGLSAQHAAARTIATLHQLGIKEVEALSRNSLIAVRVTEAQLSELAEREVIARILATRPGQGPAPRNPS